MEEAYIYDTVRSPRGKGKKGSLNELTAVTLSAKILPVFLFFIFAEV